MSLFLGAIIAFIWPFAIAAAAWAIAVWALSQPDEQSLLVKRLTTPPRSSLAINDGCVARLGTSPTDINSRGNITMNRILAVALGAAVALSSTSVASAHTLHWRSGMSRAVGFGHCAKGPCMKRSSFAASISHRHLGNGQCQVSGVDGYRFGSRFGC